MSSDDAVMPLPGGGHADPPERLSPFQQHVVAVVSTLEPGDLVTYGEVALEAGHPGAGQAVANVLRRVPGLPWWRVLPMDGRLYRQHREVATALLVAEGHRVDETGRVHPAP
ncbi:MGMT family protein [Aeromicrobium fastidiosum]|uniref:MGMT family protein n=1 Tax=Aeromicrobium fastidiosum TaxID=52699 RepID=UPI00202353F0|nr:MGMT family protein [Aeromicrobium fastidiosum]MCL8250431.1 MGMT family protein [Aeromicrobium fastidiosum]